MITIILSVLGAIGLILTGFAVVWVKDSQESSTCALCATLWLGAVTAAAFAAAYWALPSM